MSPAPALDTLPGRVSSSNLSKTKREPAMGLGALGGGEGRVPPVVPPGQFLVLSQINLQGEQLRRGVVSEQETEEVLFLEQSPAPPQP